jgi:beta-lactamase class D
MRVTWQFAPVLLCTILLGCRPAPPDPPEIGPYFEGREGTFVFLDGRTGQIIRHNPERASRRFLPASTFKIASTLIALETGVADGRTFALAWDSVAAPRQPWWPASWGRDHTLETALRNSVVWFYQELARRIGAERMQMHLDRFDYGTRDLSGGIDRFWLTGGLGISAEEQVQFLRRFHSGALGVSDRATQLVKDLLVMEDSVGYRLSGKTGWAGLGDTTGAGIGWLVGYVERDGSVDFYAMNLEIRESADVALRFPITRAILQTLGRLGTGP